MFDFGKTNSKFENGMAEFFGISQLPIPPRPNILFEIISARNVIPQTSQQEEKKEEEEENNGYHCIVKIGSKTIHRTEVNNRQKKIATENIAIWTIQTGSLGLVHVPEEQKNRKKSNIEMTKTEKTTLSVIKEVLIQSL